TRGKTGAFAPRRGDGRGASGTWGTPSGRSITHFLRNSSMRIGLCQDKLLHFELHPGADLKPELYLVYTDYNGRKFRCAGAGEVLRGSGCHTRRPSEPPSINSCIPCDGCTSGRCAIGDPG